jgi:predicted nucleotide-binding protein
MDINKLRNLIRTGELLEENYIDDKVRSRWLFDVEEFAGENGYSNKLSSEIASLKFHGGKPIAKQKFQSIMGFLRSVYDRDTSKNKLISENSQSVFIVHGHDDSLISDVKNCVEQLSLKPIVLREQTNNGQTIIEKLEDWLENCKCAIILYTPCDVGHSVNTTNNEQRARQNVVYEHGLFQGHLDRKRVIVLRKGNTVLPSDISGVVYVPVDDIGWTDILKNEIQAIDK